jgi:hypothetical protein
MTPRLPRRLVSLWILDLVLLGLLVAPMSDASAWRIALGLWAVPTVLLGFATWRAQHAHGPSPPVKSR